MEDIHANISRYVDENHTSHVPIMSVADGIKREVVHKTGFAKPRYVDEDHTSSEILPAGHGIKREVVHKVVSDLTGEVVVEDVWYPTHKEDRFRRLTFVGKGLPIRSEALLSTTRTSEASMEVVDNYFGNLYHDGVMAGMQLLSKYYSIPDTFVEVSKVAVIGLGSGLLPMFMKRVGPPYLRIEVVELDPIVLDVAREYFGFKEDELLKVHIGDGVEFVEELAVEEKVDILVVDVPSSRPGYDLVYPDEKFLEESFLLAASESLSEKGVFVMHFVTSSFAMKYHRYELLYKIFPKVFVFQINTEGGSVLNDVIFAVKADAPIKINEFFQARDQLVNTLLHQNQPWHFGALRLLNSLLLFKY